MNNKAVLQRFFRDTCVHMYIITLYFILVSLFRLLVNYGVFEHRGGSSEYSSEVWPAAVDTSRLWKGAARDSLNRQHLQLFNCFQLSPLETRKRLPSESSFTAQKSVPSSSARGNRHLFALRLKRSPLPATTFRDRSKNYSRVDQRGLVRLDSFLFGNVILFGALISVPSLDVYVDTVGSACCQAFCLSHVVGFHSLHPGFTHRQQCKKNAEQRFFLKRLATHEQHKQ